MRLWNSSLIGTTSAGAVRDLRVPMMGHGDKVLLIASGKRLPFLRGHQHSCLPDAISAGEYGRKHVPHFSGGAGAVHPHRWQCGHLKS